MFESSNNQFSTSLSDLFTSANAAQLFNDPTLFNSELTLREVRSGQSSESRSSFFQSVLTTLKSYFSGNENLNAASDASDSYEQTAITQLSTWYNQYYGNGYVNAGAAIARITGGTSYYDFPDYGGYNWGIDYVSAPEVWARGFTGQDIVVAVIDTGVSYTHSDLDNNIWINWDETYGNGIDDDRNGYVDDVLGWNFVDNNNNPMDADGHGTHVAGIIASENNSTGTIGVAFNSKIMPIRVLGNNGGTVENIAKGIVYAVNNGAQVINLSLGGSYSSEIAAAVKYANDQGVFVVMAAGNEGSTEPSYPAHLATDWGVAVGSINSTGSMSNFSNRSGNNSNLKYVAAPGSSIYSTYLNNGYTYMSGTSMATPFVSGIAALMKSANPFLTPAQMSQILTESAFG